MKRGQSLTTSASFAVLARRIARRHDTLRLLVTVLRQQAVDQGDSATVSLIDTTLLRIDEGDPIKLNLLDKLRKLRAEK